MELPEDILGEILKYPVKIQYPVSKKFSEIRRKKYTGGIHVRGNRGLLELFDRNRIFKYPDVSEIEIEIPDTEMIAFLLGVVRAGIRKIKIIFNGEYYHPLFFYNIVPEIYNEIQEGSVLIIYERYKLIFSSNPLYVNNYSQNFRNLELDDLIRKNIDRGSINTLYYRKFPSFESHPNINGLYNFELFDPLPENITKLYNPLIVSENERTYFQVEYAEIPLDKYLHHHYFPRATIVFVASLASNMISDINDLISDSAIHEEWFLRENELRIERIRRQLVRILEGKQYALEGGFRILDPNGNLNLIEIFDNLVSPI